MLRLTILCAITSATLVDPVQADTTCTLNDNFCVPFVGCTQDGQNFFTGRTFGRESGPLTATGADGTACRGMWRRTFLGAGVAKFECSDGNTGRARYTYFERSSGTALGRGRTKAGDRLTFLAGHNIGTYVLANNGLDKTLLSCVTRALSAKPG
ncbi:hypothetical protein [uncultured Tateyamaria sp.]|uniref:hypothetical protein n=1 Tax=uncultured Tateyamaria sp. TaxID=455651 RepID=UPI00261B83D2|nr:hypothetical protein [uncultured Tateyamaria sp.]